jgi:hypothetical protein
VVAVLGRHLARGLGRGDETSLAVEVLGAGHPLARALDLIEVLLRQSTATGLVVVICAAGVLFGADWARAPLIAAVTVQLVLAAFLAAAVALRRERARDLLIEGRDVRLPVLARERQRLLAYRHRETLADTLEDLVHCAERLDRMLPMSRPVYHGFVVRQLASELLALAADLRSATVGVRGVARTERLLTIGTSPLFGTETEELRAELARIRTDVADSAPASRDWSRSHQSMHSGK